MDFGPDAAVALLEAVGVGGDRRPGTLRDRVEGQGWPRGFQLDRCERLELGIDEHLPATVGDRRLADGVEKHLLRGGIGVGPHDDAAPLAAGRYGADAVGIAADGVVVVRSKLDVVGGGAEHLEGRRGPRRDRAGRGADVEDGGAELQDRSLVDHHRHALRHGERPAVGQRRALQAGADEIGEVRGVADDADDRLGADVGDRRLDGVVGRGEGAIAAGRGGLVDVDGVGCRGGVEPEVMGTARFAVAVAVERRARGIDDRRAGRARGREGQLELVGAVAAAAIAAVAHAGIECRVAGTRDGKKISAGRHVEADEGIAAVIVVVTGDHRPHRLAVDGVLPVEGDDAVERARGDLTRTGDDRLGGQLARLVERERVEVHVGAVGRKILDELLGVVVAGEDGLSRQAAAHDRWQVVGVGQAEVVADFVHRNLKPGAAVFAGAPVDPGIHDRGGARDPRDAGRREGGSIGPDVARGDRHAARLGLLEPDACGATVDLEDLAGPLLLLGRDRVVENVTGWIRAVHVLEVVLDDRNGASIRREDRSRTMLRGVHRNLAVAGLIHGARLPGVLEGACRRGYDPARSIDHGVHRGAAGRERPKIRCRGEARVVVGEVRALLHRGRSGDRGRGVADLQPVLLVVGDRARGECQHGFCRGSVVGDGRRIDRGHRLVGARGRVDLEQLVGGDRSRGAGGERIFAIEIDRDRVAILRQGVAHAGDRLRYDRHNECTDIDPEIEVVGGAAAEGISRCGPLGQRFEATADHDPVGIVGQDVREADDHLVLVGEVVHRELHVDTAHQRDVALRARSAEAVSGGAAPHDRDIPERGGVDANARAEPKRECLRRFGQRGGRLAADEKRCRAGGISRNEVERHHAAFFKPLKLTVVNSGVTLPSGEPTRPTIEDLVHCRPPGCLRHENRLLER